MEINNNILGAMQVFKEATLKDLKVDKTIICKVLSFNESDNTYVVSNDSIKFIAYPNSDTKYSVGNQVSVIIPKGDFSSKQKKLITGKYSDGDSDIVYTDSYEDLIILYELSLNDKPFIEDIELSSEKDKCDYDFTLDKYNSFNDFSNNPKEKFEDIVEYSTWRTGLKPYTILGLSFQIEVKLNSKKNYWVSLDIKDNNNKTNTFTYYSFEMSGNPNYYDGKFIQQKYFSIPDNLNFEEEIKIILGHDKLDEDEWIKIFNIKLSVGYQQNDFEKEEYSFIKREGIMSKDGDDSLYPFYQSQLYLIAYDSNIQKYKYVKNLSELPENYEINWSLGYVCPELITERKDFTNNYWIWQTKKQSKIADNNIPLSAIIFKNNGRNPIDYPSWWFPLPRWIGDKNNEEGGIQNLTINTVSIFCKIFKSGQELIKSEYLYWGNENPLFLVIEDPQYYNGYYLYTSYNHYEENESTGLRESSIRAKLANTKNSSIKRTLKLNLMENIEIENIKKIEWYTDHRNPEVLVPANPIITNWNNSKIGRFQIFNTDEYKQSWEENFGKVTFTETYLDFLTINNPTEDQLDIDFFLAENADFNPENITIFTTFLCRIFIGEDKNPTYISYLTIPISSTNSSNIEINSKEEDNGVEINRKGLELKKPKNIEYIFTDKISQSQIDENSLFITSDLNLSWAQNSIIANNNEEWLNGMFYNINNINDKNFSAVINLHEELQSKSIIENYNVLSSSFKGRSLDYPETLEFKDYLPIGLNLTNQENVYLSIEVKDPSKQGEEQIVNSDFWNTVFKEEDLEKYNNFQYRPSLRDFTSSEIEWEIIAEGTSVLQKDDENSIPSFSFVKYTDYFFINLNLFTDSEEDKYIYKTCLVIKKKGSEEILWIQPLYIIPKE